MGSLSEQYIAAVLRRLPRTLRPEVEAELHATIADMIADRGAGDPGEAERNALIQLGDPAGVAAEYTGAAQHLIGPAMYPDYVRLLKVLVPVVLPVVALIIALPRVVIDDGEPLQVIGATLLGTFFIGVQLVFWTTVVFAIAERTGGRHRHFRTSWSPDDLSRENLTSSRPDAVISLIAVVLLLGFLPWQHFFSVVPILDPYLWRGWLPAIGVLFAGVLIIDVYRIKHGQWTLRMAALAIMLDLAIFSVLVWAAMASPIVSPAFLAALGGSPAEFNQWIVVGIFAVYLIGDIVACAAAVNSRATTVASGALSTQE
ncbi:hypothetical protein [Hoyosella subflava]|uniref:Uncharacterized protein n=1 Tax=Hoyosella subflava (strain DSM 45089 / JCM 17490 / NBRC 109087 / DQS3-9A1) TaxID=443218 RepID=F6EK99_HOYSD|nr:hypothetical protein [Hoyosella subflava]AEF42640.1 hypothetical protein AS9A_4207 [Hoyosella subflava DQS3-9A1]